MPFLYLALGSNIEPRQDFITQAIEQIEKAFHKGALVSSLYETQPYLGLDQPGYLNACLKIETSLEAKTILGLLQGIETKLGRLPDKSPWSSRSLDLDILLYGQRVIEEPRLSVPHYDLTQRDFFLIPLLEIEPLLCCPKTGQPLSLALEQLPSRLKTMPVIKQSLAN